MQIEVRKSEAKVVREYPYLAEFNADPEFIMLFLSKGTGIVVNDIKSGHPIGEYSDEWTEDNYTPIAKVKKLIIETE